MFIRLLTLLIPALILPLKALAYHKPSAGIGFTNNANYENSDQDSDIYFWAQNFSYLERDTNNYSLFLKYKNHLEFSEYNALSWMASAERKPPGFLNKLDFWNLGFGGTHYTSGNPGTTEDSFDNIYFETSLVKELAPKPKIQLILEPGLRSKYYLDFGGRFDQSFYGLVQLWTKINKASIFTSALLELVFSNNSLYRRNIFEFSLGGNYPINDSWKAEAEIGLSYTGYPGRRVNVETAVSRNRNRTVVTSQDEKETYNSLSLRASAVKLWKSLDYKGSLYVISQNSKSGYVDYSEMRLEASVSKKF